MGKKLLITLSAVTLLGIVGGVLTLPSAASSQTPPIGSWGRPKGWSPSGESVSIQSHEGGQTIRFRAVSGNFQFINVDGRGEQPGDYVVVRDFLVRNGRRVGTTVAICTFQFPHTRRVFTIQCAGSFMFTGRGEITVAGRFQFRETGASDTTIAITGGTGHFQNVRGEFHITERGGILHLLP